MAIEQIGDSLADYLAAHYGICDLDPCDCQVKRIMRPFCKHWKACGAKTWDELAAKMREQYAPKVGRID